MAGASSGAIDFERCSHIAAKGAATLLEMPCAGVADSMAAGNEGSVNAVGEADLTDPCTLSLFCSLLCLLHGLHNT